MYSMTFKHYQARFESVTDPATGKITAGHTVQPLKQLGNTRQRGSLDPLSAGRPRCLRPSSSITTPFAAACGNWPI